MLTPVLFALVGGLFRPDQLVDSCPRPIPHDSVRLAVGATASRYVDSRIKRNHTGVWVDSGGVYRLVAHGEWKDGRIRPSTAAGYGLDAVPWYGVPLMWVAQFITRAPSAGWFALVGEVSSRRRQFFVIGDSLPEWVAPADGEVIGFANDVNFSYRNNAGCVELGVQRVR